MEGPGKHPELIALKKLSKRLGNDPLQVQGAGGNTSIKIDDNLWIKASGTWLKHAQEKQLFVPVSLKPLLNALHRSDPSAEKSTAFIVEEYNPSNLRPSIETTLHAVLSDRVVIHTHCVDTIAMAVLKDSEQMLENKLKNYSWLWVPYRRPGLPLSKYILEHKKPDTNVIILGNHGLVVSADSVEAAEKLLHSVRNSLRQPVRFQHFKDSDELEDLCSGSDYKPARDPVTHSLAFDKISLNIAKAGSLYPDHVIFLGDGTTVVDKFESISETVSRVVNESNTPPISIVLPDKGVVMKTDANPGQHAMARCIADVTARMPSKAKYRYLTDNDVHALVNWEAEAYRQALNN